MFIFAYSIYLQWLNAEDSLAMLIKLSNFIDDIVHNNTSESGEVLHESACVEGQAGVAES